MEYANGKIYKLVSNVSTDIYIGSTCTDLNKRKFKHKADYKRWKNGKSGFMTSFKLFEIGKVDIVLVESFPCKNKEELHAKERYWIENLDCVNKNIPTRKSIEYYYDHREILLNNLQEKYNNKLYNPLSEFKRLSKIRI